VFSAITAWALMRTVPKEVTPSGMIARSGHYTVRSRFYDDDHNVYLDFEWSFKLAKD